MMTETEMQTQRGTRNTSAMKETHTQLSMKKRNRFIGKQKHRHSEKRRQTDTMRDVETGLLIQ